MFGNKNKNSTKSDIYPQSVKRASLTLRRENYLLQLKGISMGEINGKEEILDETIIRDHLFLPLDNIVEDCPRTKYIPKMSEIIINFQGDHLNINASSENNRSPRDRETKDDSQTNAFFEVREPKWSLDEVYLPGETKEKILSALSLINNHNKLINEWGLERALKRGRGVVLNFFGPPGTGKSITAEAIAKSLNKKILVVNYAELESKYVGDTPKNIKKAFRQATEENAVLVFDEADSFLGKRLTNLTQAADYGVNVTRSTMFMEIEEYSGVLIFTTNLMQNYDQAFMRRILANIEFFYPDLEGRKKIWSLLLPESVPIEKGLTISELATAYEEITGADIRDIVINAACMALNEESAFIKKIHFDRAAALVKNRYLTQKKKSEE